MNWFQVREVAWREVLTRSRTKSFRVITGILVAAAIGGPLLVAVLPDDSDDLRQVEIGFVEADSATRQSIAALAAGSLDVTFVDLAATSSDGVDQALSDGDVDLVIEPGPTLVWDEGTDFEIASIVYSALQQQEVLVKGRALGLDQSEIADLLTPADLEERFADEPDESDGVVTTVALIGLMAAFILPQVFGQLTLLSVVEEKSTRVVEVLLNHLRPRTLLLGKVLGLSALAIVQMVIAIAGLTAALLVTTTIEIPNAVWRFLPIIAVSIVGGLVIYNTFFALLGSLVSRQEDASQVILPLYLPIMVGYFVGQAALFGDAETTLVKALTWFPLTAPMLLPLRVARDAIAPWEVLLSLGLLVVGTWALIRIAGRVYRFTLLHTGSRVGWSRLLQLMRGGSLE